MHALLDRLARFSAHRPWVVLGSWLVVLVGVLLLRGLFGGTYVNDDTVRLRNPTAPPDAAKPALPAAR